MGKIIEKIKYYFSKIIVFIQVPSLRNCAIDKTSKIGARSNLISVKMGRYSYCGNNNSISTTTIGSFCSIASYCAIGGGEHPLFMVSTSPVFYEKRKFKKEFGGINEFRQRQTEIGNDVWIGEGVFIRAGIRIGNGAVIGAHAVVTHDVPDYAIVAGAPAKIIKYRFQTEDIEFLNRIQWWNWNEKQLKEYGAFMSSPKELKLQMEKVGNKNEDITH